MFERYDKKQIYEYCEIRSVMVRIDVIRSTITMPDLAQAQVKLVPVNCNRARDCKRQGVSCIVYQREGADPCPQAWEREF